MPIKSKKAPRADAMQSMRQILATAEHVLDEDPQASLLKIAEAAGLTRVTIYRHFSSRNELLETMTSEAYRETLQMMDAIPWDSEDFVTALQMMTLESMKSAARWRVVALHPQLRAKVVQRYRHQLRAKIDEVFQKGWKEGLFNPELEPVWVHVTYFGLLQQARRKEKELGYSIEKLSSLVMTTFFAGVSLQQKRRF